jgi:hypothetical protein
MASLRGTRVSAVIELTGGDPSRDRYQDVRLLYVQLWSSGSTAFASNASGPSNLMAASDIRSAAD